MASGSWAFVRPVFRNHSILSVYFKKRFEVNISHVYIDSKICVTLFLWGWLPCCKALSMSISKQFLYKFIECIYEYFVWDDVWPLSTTVVSHVRNVYYIRHLVMTAVLDICKDTKMRSLHDLVLILVFISHTFASFGIWTRNRCSLFRPDGNLRVFRMVYDRYKMYKRI